MRYVINYLIVFLTITILICFQGNNGESFTELYTGGLRQYKVLKLSTSTAYRFRLYSTNGHGRR